MITITEQNFDCHDIIQGLRREDAGALVTFIGTVRGFAEMIGKDKRNERVEVKQLVYECYKDMALEKMTRIRDFAMVNYNISDMHMIHRTGTLKPAEQIVMIAVCAAHRKDAFKACEYAIEELKKSVPIWKKEFTSEKEYWMGAEKEKADRTD